jgi:uncharacterized membrane protein
MSFIRQNPLSCGALTLLVLVSAVLYPNLPERVIMGYDFDGGVDLTRPKDVAATLIPGIYAMVLILTHALIRYSPEKFSMPNSKRAIDIVMCGVGLMLVFLHYGLLGSRGDFDYFVRYFSWGMALSLIVIGNVFGKTERNFLLGVRTPWAIASAANWKATHRLLGKLMVGFGLVLLVSNFLFSRLEFTVFLCVSSFLIPAVYSLVYYLRFEQSRPEA